jgi:hypothetical protein
MDLSSSSAALDPLQETIDYIAVRRLMDAYADVVTRRAWPELSELFRPDALVVVDKRSGNPLELPGPTAVGDFIANAIAGFSFFEFVILGTRVQLATGGDGNAATSRMYMSELRQEAANGHWSTVYGVYHDRFTRLDGRWWFAGRRYHSLARTSVEMDLFAFPVHLADLDGPTP